MPIEPTESATPTGTDRRAFLTRSAAGGAFVATAAATGLTALGVSAAAAQESAPPTTEQEFAAKAAPLELAASVAYSAALAGDAVSGELADTLRQFQSNHQGVAATLTDAMHPDDPAPTADPAVAARFSPPAGADEASVATLLAALEDSLSATHLSAIPSFENTSFAKVIAQALAVEAQQAVVLGRASGGSIESLTPATASTDGALEPGETPAPAAEGDAGDAAGGDQAGEVEGSGAGDSGNATDSGNETDTGGDDTETSAPDAEGADADAGTTDGSTN